MKNTSDTVLRVTVDEGPFKIGSIKMLFLYAWCVNYVLHTAVCVYLG